MSKKKQKLPPDPEGMNDQRAEWADVALVAFMDETRQECREEALIDLVCDLLHLADRENMCPKQLLRMAKNHYTEETRADE